MTTKPSLKAAKKAATKPSKVTYVATAKHIELASQAGAASGTMVTAREAFNKAAKELHDAKVIIGDLRTCPLAKAFIASRFTGKASAAVKSNALSAFRKSVQTGAEYSENAGRDKKKAAAKKTGAKHNAPKDSKESADSDDEKDSADKETKFVIAIAKRGSAEKAAKEFRKLVNKMKESEEYSDLALLLIDALDDFEGLV
jgi:flagellar biosynthesis GTPase FlhF